MAQWELENNQDKIPLEQKPGNDATALPWTSSEWAPNLQTERRYSKRGVNITGDETPGERTFSINWLDSKLTQALYRAYVNDFVQFFDPQRGPFYFNDNTNQIRCAVRLQKFKPTFRVVNMVADFTIDLVMIDGAFEDLSLTLYEAGLQTHEDEFTVTNDGNLDAYPVIAVEFVDDITQFRIRNTTNGSTFLISNSGFTSGRICELDSQEGTIELESVNISNALEAGGFIFLSPGANVLRYEAVQGDANIDVSWRAAYAY